MSVDMKDPSNWISKDLFLSYCGEKSDQPSKVADFYDQAVSSRSQFIPSLNWLAILLFPAWLGYRKQWTALAALTVLFAVMHVLEAALSFHIPYVATGVPLLVIGLFANGLLLYRANSIYFKLQEAGLDKKSIQAKMADGAKSSAGLAVLGLFGFLIIENLIRHYLVKLILDIRSSCRRQPNLVDEPLKNWRILFFELVEKIKFSTILDSLRSLE